MEDMHEFVVGPPPADRMVGGGGPDHDFGPRVGPPPTRPLDLSGLLGPDLKATAEQKLIGPDCAPPSVVPM